MLRSSLATTLLGFALIAQGQQLSPDAAELLDRARADMNRNKFEDAIGGLRRILKNNPQCAECYVHLVNAYQKIGAHKDALDSARKLLAVVTDDRSKVFAHNLMGVELSALADAGRSRHDQAVTEFLIAVQLDPDLASAYFNLGVALLKDGREAEGLSALRDYLKRAPDGPNARGAHELLENPRRAREHYVPTDFSIVTTSGSFITPEDVKGKVVLLDFWASWCKPCEASLPTLQRLAKKYSKDPFMLISISVDSDEHAWQQFTSTHRMDWTQTIDRDFKLRRMFDVKPIPTYLLVDAEGIIRSYVIGEGGNQAGLLEDAIKKGLKTARNQPQPVTISMAPLPPPAPVTSPQPAAAMPTQPAPTPLPPAPAPTPAPVAQSAPPPAAPRTQAPADGPETLYVTSNPDGGEIYLDFNLIGNAPATLRLQPGRHNIRVTLPGYRSWTNDVTAQPGAEARLNANLVKTTPSTLHGRVVWNEQPLAGVQVAVRECSMPQPIYGPVTTDAKGNFTITGVPDSRICVNPRPPSAEFFPGAAAMVEVQPGIETTAPDSYLCKAVTPISPRVNEAVNQARPALKWNPFPEAVNYSVQVWKLPPPDRRYTAVFTRGQMNRDERFSSPGIQVDVDMAPGEYYYRVEAFNRSGHVIGCLNMTRFTVAASGN